MSLPLSPCRDCKKAECPEVCYPRQDYINAMRKRERILDAYKFDVKRRALSRMKKYGGGKRR